MYAAAGGASLASRQARLKQRKQVKNDRLQQIKNQKVGDSKLPPRQFQNYTEPKIKLSRIEQSAALRPPPLHADARRHSTSHLKEPSKARIKESPSVLIPLPHHLNQSHHHHHHHQQQHHHHHQDVPVTPCTLVQEHASLHPSCSIQSQLPQIFIPEGENKLERRCSFVRQVEEMGKCQDEGLIDRCSNHICNLEIQDKQQWDNNLTYYSEFHRSAFGSLDYPFSEIHDSSYGGESEEDIFAVYHQSAAANALLYVGLGTTAIGSVVFFVGSGDKGFKTLELRLIGPTLVACGLLCCLIRILLCACPSTCLRRRKKTRLKNVCPHSSSRYPLHNQDKNTNDFLAMDPTTSLITKPKKRVSIAQTKPSTSAAEELPFPHCSSIDEYKVNVNFYAEQKTNIPVISVPEFQEFNSGSTKIYRDEPSIELENLEMTYELESVTSNEDSENIVIENETKKPSNKLNRTRVPVHGNIAEVSDDKETSLSIVVERSDNSECSGDRSEKSEKQNGHKSHDSDKLSHSGILLSPLQLEQ